MITLVLVGGVLLLGLCTGLGIRMLRARSTPPVDKTLDELARHLDGVVPSSVVRYAAESESVVALKDADSYGRVLRRILSIYAEYQEARIERTNVQECRIEIEALRVEIRLLRGDLDQKVSSAQVVVVLLTTLGSLAGLAGVVVAVVNLATS